MTSFERSGITVEQCSGCRGIFLDRGELDRLLDLEADPGRAEQRERARDADRDAGRRKRGGFLGDFLDFGG
jgi:Zn-finger nucleic acid-binding protein